MARDVFLFSNFRPLKHSTDSRWQLSGSIISRKVKRKIYKMLLNDINMKHSQSIEDIGVVT